MNLPHRTLFISLGGFIAVILVAGAIYLAHKPPIGPASEMLSPVSNNVVEPSASGQSQWAMEAIKPFKLNSNATTTGPVGYFPTQWLSFIYPRLNGVFWFAYGDGSYEYVAPYNPVVAMSDDRKEGYGTSFYFNYYFADGDPNDSTETIDAFMENHYPGINLSNAASFRRGPFEGYAFSHQDTGMSSPKEDYLVFKYRETPLFFEMINIDELAANGFSAIVDSITPLGN
jgi:hypothetical protein